MNVGLRGLECPERLRPFGPEDLAPVILDQGL